MSIHSSRRSNNNKKDSIYREIAGGVFISIRTINEIEDVIDTSEAYMTDPTVIFNSDNTKVIFYYNTEDENEIEEMETLFKNTVSNGSTITLSDAFYLNELSGDDSTYDLGGTYKFEKYDINTKTIIASPISINKQSNTNLKYDSRYWLGSLLWTTADAITTRTISYEIINFIGSASAQSFTSMFGEIQKNDRIEIQGMGTYTVDTFSVDADEGWERIKIKEEIAENDLLGETTYIRLLRSGRNQIKSKPEPSIVIDTTEVNTPIVSSTSSKCTCVDFSSKPYTCVDMLGANSKNDCERQDDHYCVGEKDCWTWERSNTSTPSSLVAEQTLINRRTEESMHGQVSWSSSEKDDSVLNWLSTGSKTLRTMVVPTTDGIAFTLGNENPRATIDLQVGTTVQIIQTDKSNGRFGFSRGLHPLIFSETPDGHHSGGIDLELDWVSDKEVGTRGYYAYFTVPNNISSLYYLCHHHPNLGGEIKLISSNGETQRASGGPVIINGGGKPSVDIDITVSHCCPCLGCLDDCMREVECYTSCKNGHCDPPNTDGGTDCGPYQIDTANYWTDICDSLGPCQRDGIQRCCDICDDPDYGNMLCNCNCETNYNSTACGGHTSEDACCAEKERKSLALIECYRLRWTRRGIGSPNDPCPGSGGTLPYQTCYTCEDLGRMHQGGNCGHINPTPFNDEHWRRLKACMDKKCPDCEASSPIHEERATVRTSTLRNSTPPSSGGY
jgi:hypothetical protein